MAEQCSLDLPQIKSVLEVKAKKLFGDWVLATKEPEKYLDSAIVKISEQLNHSVLQNCPSAEGYKVVVVFLATKQVRKFRIFTFELSPSLEVANQACISLDLTLIWTSLAPLLW